MCNVIIPEVRMNVLVVNEKLNNLSGTNKNAVPQLVVLTLTKESKKHKWSAKAPFPAVVKDSAEGLAVYNCTTGKKETIDFNSYKINEVGEDFEYKGHRYIKKDTVNGLPRFTVEKANL